MDYSFSTIYGEGQHFYTTIDQGSTYLGFSFTSPLNFNYNYSITEPRGPALNLPTVVNYSAPSNNYFMGNFSGFWVHNIYRDGHLVYTTQGVNQQLFIAIQHDFVESVSMSFASESIPYDGPVRPPVPGPSVISALAVGALVFAARKRTR
jgi:hypothetical protein